MFDDIFDSGCGFDDSVSVFDDTTCCHDDCIGDINPGSGLPMSDCSIDVGGYIYGDGPDYSEI